ncbi:MAG: CRISPR-associated helicase Cas3' [Halomonas sp.]|uniref:CRISPR-associated helicase Cas3' n=1 Tax=Halomonas sp. TaxID=1486246 RepID=UPI002ACD6785|nr:CRISPR-associated helicase Cas3' [Halomonas sp.]MDZ7854511.1 CRISPR-associated helicase Cas3' [Halomonas sp.]
MTDTGDVTFGRGVFNHCQIVGEVARVLSSRYATSLKVQLFPDGAELVAACHDIGKVSPTFVEKLYRAAGRGTHSHPSLANVDPGLERQWGGHAGVSQVAVQAMKVPARIPEVLGQHHGYSPPVADKRANDDRFGGPPWQQERERLVEALKGALQSEWPEALTPTQARVLAGLTTVADWIGSGQFFEDPAADWKPRVSQAIEDAGFLPVTVTPDLAFEDIFPFYPNAAQAKLAEVANRPGVFLLEAPMGLGKTEAALYVAYQQLAQGEASGIYFALPTQLTSNRIYTRFNAFLDAILPSGDPRQGLLLHGHAWLVETEMGEEGRPGGAWFNQAKRGLLAPFAVGTLDQALMAVMNVKHGFVRAFGLAGKVVILDEVHTYDAYTGTLLDALIDFLREAGCTVIILTATLARERRQQLLGIEVAKDHYPLITACPTAGDPVEVELPSPPARSVDVTLTDREETAVEEALARAEGGQQVLWIENTVGEAQERFRVLAARSAELEVEVGLLHSRFTPQHRAAREDIWVTLYGNQAWEKRTRTGRLLVGTQVLEQSLDIDADFLISRFCPTDMLLQRLGRLWRHEDTPRPAGSRQEAWLLAPELAPAITQPDKAFGVTAAVYHPYVLCRSLEVWQGREAVTLPDDIRPMIDATYAGRDEVGDMARWYRELQEGNRRRTGRRAMEQLARGALAQGGKTLPEHKAGTRYSDIDSVEVLLLREVRPDAGRRATRLVLLDGEQHWLPWDRHMLTRPQWRCLSADLTRQQVRVPIYHLISNDRQPGLP